MTVPDWNPAEVAAGTADPAFVSDEQGVVVGWNEAAESLLGRSAEETVGKPCYEVLCGRDNFGNRFCDRGCAIMKMSQRGESARLFVLDVLKASGRRLPVRVTVLRLQSSEPSRFLMVHVLVPAELPGFWSSPVPTGRASEVTSAPAEGGVSASDQGKIRALTPRETEVLGLLATGNASQDVASKLFISLATVRTHVQNILRKLEVHSQLEAVALAFKMGLV